MIIFFITVQTTPLNLTSMITNNSLSHRTAIYNFIRLKGSVHINTNVLTINNGMAYAVTQDSNERQGLARADKLPNTNGAKLLTIQSGIYLAVTP